MITSFRGPYAFLSNFYPTEIQYEGMVFPSAEHAFQAAKTLDPVLRAKISDLPTPGQAKRAGKSLPLRPLWNETRIAVMEQIVTIKFQDKGLAQSLRATGREHLIEGNTWGDTFWGMVVRDSKYVGQNHLGEILMRVRESL